MNELFKIPKPNQIKRLPKALLHDHLDGGLRPQTIIDIAREIGYTALPTDDADELAIWFREACDSGPIDMVSTGPDRTHTIVLRHPYKA